MDNFKFEDAWPDNGIEDLTQYNIESTKLKEELRIQKMPYPELLKRKKLLTDLIPFCWIVDDFGLYALIDEVYADDPYHKKYRENMFMTVTVNVEPQTPEEIEAIVKKYVDKFKKKS